MDPNPETADPALRLFEWDEGSERLRVEAEIRLLKRLRIGDRAMVTFKTRLDHRFRLVECDPRDEIGTIVALELHEGRGHVTISFDGQETPVGPFSPLEIRLIRGRKN